MEGVSPICSRRDKRGAVVVEPVTAANGVVYASSMATTDNKNAVADRR
jgi:hypothetical protein